MVIFAGANGRAPGFPLDTLLPRRSPLNLSSLEDRDPLKRRKEVLQPTIVTQ